jgi:hypothetical protein
MTPDELKDMLDMLLDEYTSSLLLEELSLALRRKCSRLGKLGWSQDTLFKYSQSANELHRMAKMLAWVT